MRSSPGCSGPGVVCPFDISNVLTTPFFYNPANGNLLLEVISSGFQDLIGGSALDGQMFAPAGSLVAEVAAFGSTTATAGSLEPRALVAQFTFTAVPEPASWIITGLGLSAFLWANQRRRFKSRS